MKMAVQEALVPGNTFTERLERIAEYGYEGVELFGGTLLEHMPEVKRALAQYPVGPAAICEGFTSCLLYPDKEARERSKAEMTRLLQLGGEIGAAGLIVVPVFGDVKLPDLSPRWSALELEEGLIVEQLGALADIAGREGTKVILEPINRYETHYLTRLDQAVALCEQVASPHMVMLADFFHMNIEEADIPASLEASSPWLGYVHLADSQRDVPGEGHTDFRSGFAALQRIGYSGYMSLECTLPERSGDKLVRSLAFMKSLL